MRVLQARCGSPRLTGRPASFTGPSSREPSGPEFWVACCPRVPSTTARCVVAARGKPPTLHAGLALAHPQEFFGTHALSVKARAPFKNPMASMDGMKTQVAFMATNYGMGYWTQAFFSGFVLVRMPFPLTTRFKQMTQSDLALATLDTSFVSSLSWYMIVLYGIRTLVMLAMGNSSSDAMDEAKMMQMQMGMGAGASPQWDPNSAYKAERTNYELAQYTDLLAASEQELLKQVRG